MLFLSAKLKIEPKEEYKKKKRRRMLSIFMVHNASEYENIIQLKTLTVLFVGGEGGGDAVRDVYLRLLTMIILCSNETRFVIQISTTAPTPSIHSACAHTPQLFKYLWGILQGFCLIHVLCCAVFHCCHNDFYHIIFILYIMPNVRCSFFK